MKYSRLLWISAKDDPWILAATVALAGAIVANVAGNWVSPPMRWIWSSGGVCGFSLLAFKSVSVLALYRTAHSADADVIEITNNARGTGIVHYRFLAGDQPVVGQRELFLDGRHLTVLYDPKRPDRHLAFWSSSTCSEG